MPRYRIVPSIFGVTERELNGAQIPSAAMDASAAPLDVRSWAISDKPQAKQIESALSPVADV